MDAQRLLHRDAHLVVVNKPSGLLTHRGWGRDKDTAMARARDMLGQRVQLPHRLDRGTSGAIIMALDMETHRALSRAFEAGAVEKTYLALVRGHAPEKGHIDHAIRSPDRPEPLAAISDYALVAHSPLERCSLLKVWPRSGRPHQIRRHLKHISHPIIGDTRYGKGPINRHYREHYGLHRLALHALELRFEHPHSGDTLQVQAPVPDELAAILTALQLTPPTAAVETAPA